MLVAVSISRTNRVILVVYQLEASGAGEEKLKKFPVLISPDMVVWHKHVVAAFDGAIDAGFKNIQFTVPK